MNIKIYKIKIKKESMINQISNLKQEQLILLKN